MKRLFFVIPLLLVSFFFVFSSKSLATNCSTDSDCETDESANLLGCFREISGVNTTWYCQSVHPDFTYCSNDAQCNPSDSSYDSSLYGCDVRNAAGRNTYYCRVTTTLITTVTTTTTSGPFCVPGDQTSGIDTALGCIKVGSGNDLITSVLRLATGVGGGLALALILYGVFIVTTSAGSPDKLKAGSEIITSAVIGLIFILLSIFLVNLIGINILGIPGLS